MISYKRVDFCSLSPQEIEPFKELIYPIQNNFFQDPHLVAFAAYDKDSPIALIAAYSYPVIREALITSLFVKEPFRHQRIAKELFQHLLPTLKKENIYLITLNYASWEPTSPYFEKILQTIHFSPPKPIIRNFYFDPKTFHPPWFDSPDQWLSPGMEIFPWKDHTSEEEAQVRRWLKENPLLGMFTPFDHNYPLDNDTSLGLRDKGNIVGWAINLLMPPNIHCYKSFFTHPEVRGMGAAATLLKESIRRHVTLKPHLLGMGILSVQTAPAYWRRFIDRRLAPSAIRTEEIKTAYLLLS